MKRLSKLTSAGICIGAIIMLVTACSPGAGQQGGVNAVFSAETTAAVHVDAKAMSDSAFGKATSENGLETPMDEDAKEFFKLLGIEEEDIHAAALSISDLEAMDKPSDFHKSGFVAGVQIAKSIDASKIKEVLVKMEIEEGAISDKMVGEAMVIDFAYQKYGKEVPMQLALASEGETTYIFGGEPKAVESALGRYQAGDGGVQGEIKSLVNKHNAGHFWIAVAVPEKFRTEMADNSSSGGGNPMAAMGGALQHLNAVLFSATTVENLDLDLLMSFSDEKSAENLSKMLESMVMMFGQQPQIKGLVESLKFNPEKGDLKINMSVTADQINELTKEGAPFQM